MSTQNVNKNETVYQTTQCKKAPLPTFAFTNITYVTHVQISRNNVRDFCFIQQFRFGNQRKRYGKRLHCSRQAKK